MLVEATNGCEVATPLREFRRERARGRRCEPARCTCRNTKRSNGGKRHASAKYANTKNVATDVGTMQQQGTAVRQIVTLLVGVASIAGKRCESSHSPAVRDMAQRVVSLWRISTPTWKATPYLGSPSCLALESPRLRRATDWRPSHEDLGIQLRTTGVEEASGRPSSGIRRMRRPRCAAGWLGLVTWLREEWPAANRGSSRR
jgi:hypothetical protein